VNINIKIKTIFTLTLSDLADLRLIQTLKKINKNHSHNKKICGFGPDLQMTGLVELHKIIRE